MSTVLLNPSVLDPCYREMQIFLEQNSKFILDVACEVFNQNKDRCLRLGLEADDLAQMGRIKLWTKADAYDACVGASYKTFCKTIMHHAMIDGIRHAYSAQKLEMECGVSLEELNDGEDIYTPYQYELPEPSYLKKETLEELETALGQISDRDRIYLTYRFGLEDGEAHSPEDSAQYFHLKKNLGKRTEKETLRHLRENMP